MAALVDTDRHFPQEIKERKQVEDALAVSEKRLRYLSSQILTAQENERKRVAQELHDGIEQYLSAIKYRVEDAIQRLGREDTGKVKEGLKIIIPVIQEAVEEVRRICMDMIPHSLESSGILATISRFCKEFQVKYPVIRINSKISIKENDVPVLLKSVIFRIIQEALNNVARHSEADSVSLSLERRGENLILTIKDNGLGFDQRKISPIANFGRGLGLVSMKERASLSGGSLTIRSVSGTGTQVKAVWKIFSG